MVDYIRDEEEQAELFKNWWQQNGTAAIITIVLAVAALIGWREWQDHSAGQSAEASAQYQEMLQELVAPQQDSAAIVTKADALIDAYPKTAYADYARLAKAALSVQSSEFEQAVELLQAVADNGATDAIEYTASLRLARVHLHQQAWDKAQAQLDKRFPEAFNGMALELRGDLAKGQGETEVAIQRYQEALAVLQDGGEKDRVQMKLDDLKS